MSDVPVAALPQLLQALGDPVRLSIVRQLRRSVEPISCGAFGLTISKSTQSHHYKVLRDAGLIASRREAGQVLNELRSADVDAQYPGLLDAVLGGVATSGAGSHE